MHTMLMMHYFWLGFVAGFFALPVFFIVGLIIGEFLSRKRRSTF